MGVTDRVEIPVLLTENRGLRRRERPQREGGDRGLKAGWHGRRAQPLGGQY